ncbi:MAG TPA: hypothetical protein VNF75_01200 [Candidatus Dormibacteraeota bacterium]|nr:hypothetical protein [Candidatus Dormibacteraeota bacterium]
MAIGPAVLSHLPPAQAAGFTGPSFVHGPSLILIFAIVMSVIAAIASAFRVGKYVHEDDESMAQEVIVRRQACRGCRWLQHGRSGVARGYV